MELLYIRWTILTGPNVFYNNLTEADNGQLWFGHLNAFHWVCYTLIYRCFWFIWCNRIHWTSRWYWSVRKSRTLWSTRTSGTNGTLWSYGIKWISRLVTGVGLLDSWNHYFGYHGSAMSWL